MSALVLDCSVCAAWFLADESAPEADRILELLLRERAVVPQVWIAEISNVLVVAERRGRIAPADAASALELLGDLPIAVDTGGPGVMQRVRALALRHGLSAYDACYLELALRIGCRLASFDRRLRRAAVAAGVRLV